MDQITIELMRKDAAPIILKANGVLAYRIMEARTLVYGGKYFGYNQIMADRPVRVRFVEQDPILDISHLPAA